MNKILAASIVVLGIIGAVWLYTYNSPVNTCIRAEFAECERRDDCQLAERVTIISWCVKQAAGG